MLSVFRSGARPVLFLIAVVVAVFHSPAVAQNLLQSSVRTGTMTAAHTNQRISQVFGALSPGTAEGAIDLHKVTYRSTDEKGRPVTLSGLVAIPRRGAPNGLVVFNHGTQPDRRQSPSRFTGKPGAATTEEEIAILAFASGGYAVAAPDYLGLGDHIAAHPYPLNVVNSRSGIDLIGPARAVAQRQNIAVGPRLFVTGYSEGGGVAMAMTRELEKMSGPLYAVTASAPASGPYDLSDVTRQFIIAEPTTQEQFVIRLYLLSYMVYYFHKNNGLKLTDYFKPSMAFAVSGAYDNKITAEEVIKRLALTAVLMRAKNSLANVVTPRFLKAMRSLDTSDPVVRELGTQDVYDWSPRTNMLLISLQGDTIVDPANTDKAFRTMRSRGVRADTMRRFVIKDTGLTHLTAVPAAMLEARRFFDGGFAGVRDAQ